MTENENSVKDTRVKEKIGDIRMFISWREVANAYFHKSSSWLYHKLDGIDGNGKTGGFTPGEKELLRGALYDLANRIRTCADTI